MLSQVKYKEVMKQYNLGPNGGILTSLNLFATRFDQVHQLLTAHTPHMRRMLQAHTLVAVGQDASSPSALCRS
jgi:Conserved hypothetical ATP binding protein